MINICPICEEEIIGSKWLLCCDRPRFSVYIHKSCYGAEIDKNTLERILNIYNNVKIRTIVKRGV
jgi:hypothetical protein